MHRKYGKLLLHIFSGTEMESITISSYGVRHFPPSLLTKICISMFENFLSHQMMTN